MVSQVGVVMSVVLGVANGGCGAVVCGGKG